MNGSNFIGALKQNYEISSEDPSIGKVTFQNIDLFEKQDKISCALKLGYDFYIYDYGVLSSPSFHRISFLEKDRKFLVCGTSPEELSQTNQAISQFYDSDVQYLFNLVPDEDQKKHPGNDGKPGVPDVFPWIYPRSFRLFLQQQRHVPANLWKRTGNQKGTKKEKRIQMEKVVNPCRNLKKET